jgi:hypothetical protein
MFGVHLGAAALGHATARGVRVSYRPHPVATRAMYAASSGRDGVICGEGHWGS